MMFQMAEIMLSTCSLQDPHQGNHWAMSSLQPKVPSCGCWCDCPEPSSSGGPRCVARHRTDKCAQACAAGGGHGALRCCDRIVRAGLDAQEVAQCLTQILRRVSPEFSVRVWGQSSLLWARTRLNREPFAVLRGTWCGRLPRRRTRRRHGDRFVAPCSRRLNTARPSRHAASARVSTSVRIKCCPPAVLRRGTAGTRAGYCSRA